MERMFDTTEPEPNRNKGPEPAAPGNQGPPDLFGLDGVIAALESGISVETALADEQGLCSAAKLIEDARRRLDAISVRVLAELDARDATDTTHGMTTGMWLAHQANLSARSMRTRVKVANKLRRHLPAARDALDSGRIGYDHAKVLADAANPRIVDEFAAMVPELIDLSELMNFDRWAREVRAIAELLDQDGGHRPGDDVCDNYLSLSPFADESLVINGQLTRQDALVVAEALNAKADQLFKRFARDNEASADLVVPPRKTLLALALVELIREAIARPAGSSRPARSEVSLIINADDPHFVTDVDGIRIGDSTASCSTCDPVFQPIVKDTKGIVIDVGRQHRLVTAAQRRALAHRDGGCVFPGCDRPADWTDAHHIKHWRKGGLTDMANLASLCRHHHGVSHRKGWVMQVTADQYFTWTTPSGQTLHSQRRETRRRRT